MTAHNHPPRCCCEADDNPTGSNERLDCPLCPEHGELARLAEPECTSCHTVAGHPHTEYCQLANWAGHRDNCALQWGKPCDCEDQDPAPALRAEVDRIHQHLAQIDYTEGPASSPAYECQDPQCTYPRPHTHPDLINRGRTCRVCGCTDDTACPGGCAWVPDDPDRCTACPEQRPDDDPPDPIVCAVTGDCGGVPHA